MDINIEKKDEYKKGDWKKSVTKDLVLPKGIDLN